MPIVQFKAHVADQLRPSSVPPKLLFLGENQMENHSGLNPSVAGLRMPEDDEAY